jgi:hypothetical protein
MMDDDQEMSARCGKGVRGLYIFQRGCRALKLNFFIFFYLKLLKELKKVEKGFGNFFLEGVKKPKNTYGVRKNEN